MRKRQIPVLVYLLIILLLAATAAGQSRIITSPKAQFGFNLG